MALNKGTLAQNITAAIEITGLSKSFLMKLYYTTDEMVKIDDRCYGLLKKLLKPEENFVDGATKKNAIMIRRVARAKNTDDPYLIANTIIGSVNMQNQTTFRSVGDVIRFIQEHGTR